MISIGNWIHDYIDLLWKIDDERKVSTVGARALFGTSLLSVLLRIRFNEENCI